MNTRSIRHIVRRLREPIRRTLAGLGIDARPGTLVLVTGGGEWAVKQIAVALREQLTSWYADVQILDLLVQRPYLAQANVHCLCRPAFFAGSGIPALHRSNRIVVSWLHGAKSSENPEMRAACRQLEKHWQVVRRFIVPNSVTQRGVLECGVDPDRLHVIPNGVDTHKFRAASDDSERLACRRALGVPDTAFVVGSFQRDEDDAGLPKLVKGPDILREAVSRAHGRVPIHLLLAGPSREYVRRQLDARGIPYTYQRAESATDLLRFYHSIDAYLISSREEGGPATLRESLASGVPVVSTRVGLAVDLVEHGVNGLLADIDDTDALAQNLLALFLDPGLRRRLIGEGRRAIEALDFSVIAKRYQEEVYRLAFV